MRFREYLTTLTEMETTKRTSIIHFQAMKPIEFLILAREIVNQNKHLKKVKVGLKADGAGCRFGKDSEGNFFFETGRSGLIQTSKAFSAYTMNRNGNDEQLERAAHYDDMYDELEASDLWQDLPDSTKIICEILYNPMASIIDDKLKFVSIHYPKNKLGSLMTIVPISVIGEYDLEDLYKKSNSRIKIVSAHLGHVDMHLDIDLQVLDEIDENILISRKHSDRETKCEYVSILQDLKDEIADQILDYPVIGKDKLGDEIEGLVIELNDKLYKITTKSFKDEKRQERINRDRK